jgi:hypothetical protein
LIQKLSVQENIKIIFQIGVVKVYDIKFKHALQESEQTLKKYLQVFAERE